MSKTPLNPGRKLYHLQLDNINSPKQQVAQKYKGFTQPIISRNIGKTYIVPFTPKLPTKYCEELKMNMNEQRLLAGSCKTILRQKTIPKTLSTNLIKPKENFIQRTRKATIRVPRDQVQSEIKIYQWRASTNYPIMKVDFVGRKEISSRNARKIDDFCQLQIEIKWMEDVKFLLQNIERLNLLNSLYILEESLVSFERLFNKFGYFQPSLKMVFITNNLKCRIWINENIWQNHPVRSKFISSQQQKVNYFYKRIIDMFAEYFRSSIQKGLHQDSGKKSVNLVEKLIFELQRRNDFVQGMKLIKEFLTAYSLKISNRFIDLAQINEEKSRIFVKRENPIQSAMNVKTLAFIPAKSQQKDKKQKMNTKTLKNSLTNQIAEVKQSNCKTIDKKSQIAKQRQADQFKRKSHISIYSKQTIAIKKQKSRFSLHEDDIDHEQKFQHLKGILPKFTNEDFIQEGGIVTKRIIQVKQYQNSLVNVDIGDEDQEQEQEQEERMKNEIEKNVRQMNGWLNNTNLLLQTEDYAESFKDSQPSVKAAKVRDRKLSKLNKIKSSIAHSINDLSDIADLPLAF